ncbi:MAG: response regulator transcription factor [Polyangiaceae bacterium]|nr:response regulator transcription factor [Polyangiaceae bacterium]
MRRGPGDPMRVLLIDDDTRLHALLTDYLGQNGVTTERAADGATGLAALDAAPFDAVLLDVMMPGMSGLEVLERIRRKSTVPVLMLTAKGDETDRVVGLELGADDYLPKPFAPRELLARLRAVLRRGRHEPDGRVTANGVVVDPAAREAWVDSRRLDLTGLELDLLLTLVRRAGRVVPRATLLAEAGRDDVTVNDRAVDVHVSHLRRKLGDDPRAPRRIKTVRGIGYVFSRGDE